MLDFELIKNVLIIGIASGIVTSSLVQKIKENLKRKKWLIFISFVVSMVIGTLFALTFSSANFIDALWAGLFSFIGADMLYQMFEDKIFKPFSSLGNTIDIPIENEIKGVKK